MDTMSVVVVVIASEVVVGIAVVVVVFAGNCYVASRCAMCPIEDIARMGTKLCPMRNRWHHLLLVLVIMKELNNSLV